MAQPLQSKPTKGTLSSFLFAEKRFNKALKRCGQLPATAPPQCPFSQAKRTIFSLHHSSKILLALSQLSPPLPPMIAAAILQSTPSAFGLAYGTSSSAGFSSAGFGCSCFPHWPNVSQGSFRFSRLSTSAISIALGEIFPSSFHAMGQLTGKPGRMRTE